MKISDLTQDQIHIGLRVKGQSTGRLGMIVEIDYDDDNFAYIKWDDESKATSGFYGTDCECEVIKCQTA